MGWSSGLFQFLVQRLSIFYSSKYLSLEWNHLRTFLDHIEQQQLHRNQSNNKKSYPSMSPTFTQINQSTWTAPWRPTGRVPLEGLSPCCMPALSGIFSSDSRFAPSNCPVSKSVASVPPSLRCSMSPVLITRCLMCADSVFVLEERRLFSLATCAWWMNSRSSAGHSRSVQWEHGRRENWNTEGEKKREKKMHCEWIN